MESIFHEKQEGSLCAQHCLNALLQGPYFSAVDLADIARQLDESERQQMAEAGTESEAYRHFMQQPSNNYDDSGFFSVQVIDKALRVMGLELVSFNSQNPLAQQAQNDATQMMAYICNFGEHWLTVRKLGNQWFNLNSLLTGPELISDTYLSMFLTQLQQDGYSIFIVTGDLAECEADQLLRLCPAVQPIKPQLIHDRVSRSKRGEAEAGASGGENEAEVEQALEESKKLIENDDFSLQRVLQMSMEGFIEESVSRIDTACASSEGVTHIPGPFCPKENAQSHKKTVPSQQRENTSSASVSGENTTGHKLGGDSSQSENSFQSDIDNPSADEVRQKRLAFLSKLEGAQNKKVESDEKEEVEPTAINGTGTEANGEELSEEEMLKQAIAMSMSQGME